MQSGRMLVRGRQVNFALQTRGLASVVDKAKETIGKATEKVGQAFTDQGKVGKKFNPDHPDGTAGKAAQDVGGEFDKHGKIGKEFTRKGAVGGAAEKAGEKAKEGGQDLQEDAKS